MSPLPWKILVVTDLGTDTGAPRRVTADGLDAWLASSAVSIELPGLGRYALDSRSAFSPAALSAALGASAAPAALDAALHAPAFQRVEAAWRGLELLLAHAGADVEVDVTSLPRARTAERFQEAVFSPAVAENRSWSLVVIDADFSHKGPDVAQMAALAGMARVLQCPVIANASPAFFGARYFVQLATMPDPVAKLASAEHVAWQRFQATPDGRWVLLTANRVLLRAPHTAAQGHEETCSESEPDSFLWGRGGWFVAAAVARSAASRGHALDIAGSRGGAFAGLPTRAYPVKTNERAALSTEAMLPDQLATELTRSAFTPMVGRIRGDVAMMPMVVTISRLAPGRLTLEGTLAYQITAGRLAQSCAALLDTLPAGSPPERAAHVRAGLLAAMGPLAGDDPAAVTVTPREDVGDDGPHSVADVSVNTAATLEGKPLTFGFVLPL